MAGSTHVFPFALVFFVTACSRSTEPAAQAAAASPIALEFSVHPSESFVDAPINPAVTVKVLVGQSQSAYTGLVTLSLVGTGSAMLSGTTTVHAVAGVAAFANVSVNGAGQYTLRATADDVSTTSVPFKIVAKPRLAYIPCSWPQVAWDYDGTPCDGARVTFTVFDDSQRMPISLAAKYYWDPAWSPNGTSIALVGASGCTEQQSPCVFDIYVENLKDGTERRLTHGEFRFVSSPAWLPDSRRLVFSGDAVDETVGKEARIYTIDANGSNAASVGELRGLYPTWSPDGRRLAYAAASGGRYSIWVADADGSHTSTITAGGSDQFDIFPAWSPDGSRILFSRQPASFTGGLCAIFSANPDGTGLTRLTNVAVCANGPVWSPDGRQIAFNGVDAPRTNSILVMNADGTGAKRLSRTSGMESRLAWAPASPSADSNRR